MTKEMAKGKGKGKGKEKADDADGGGESRRIDKGKKIVSDDDEEEEYVADEAEEDDESSGEEIKVSRKKRQKRYTEDFELDEDDYDVLDDANVKGFRRPAHLGGKFKRLKKAGHVSARKDSGIMPDEMSEEEGSESDEEMEDESSEEDLGKYELLSTSRKKSGRGNTSNPRRGRTTDRRYKPPLGGRRNFDREALAALNEVDVDSDDNDVDDEESLSRLLMEKQYEPSLREVNYNTERVNRLLQTDIPERLQILEETSDVLPSSDLELRRVAEWIYDRAFGDLCVPSRPEFQHLLSLEKSEVVRQIANVLRLVHNEKLEIPFIGLYRREECLDLLNEPTDWFSSVEEGPTIQQYKALWAIQVWNKKWLLIQRRKTVLQVNLKERIPVDIDSTPEKDSIAKNIFRFIEEAESEQAIDDCEVQFNLHFPFDGSDCGFKRPRFRSLYSIGQQAGLGKITKYFGLTSEAFADNVKAGYKRNGILEEAFLPDDLAANFFKANTSKAEFRDPASLIRGARHMLAMEISTEPLVREHVRNFYSKNAFVNTRPTPAGIDAINTFHQFECVKWIVGKQISAFDDEQWLLIQKAEEEKLIDVTVGLSKESIDSVLFDFEQLFSSDGLSRTSPTWSEQRKLILQEAIVTLLLPIMEKEIRMTLVVRAKQVLAAKCGLQLWNKVSVAPPKVGDLDCRNEDGPALRVLACCWGPPNVGTTFVMLDADGEIMYIMRAGYLNIKSVSPEQIQRKENDQARLMQVLLNYKPHYIVLGAARVQCRYLGLNISDILFKFVEQHAGDSSEGLDSPKLVYGDEFIPSLFEASSISRIQLPGQPGDVRRAVALGRFLQNPVAMVASLCIRPSMEVRSIKFHPLQTYLSDEELDDIIERVMVTVVNQVGIDINLAIIHDWLFETLQFVAGLGPLKACEIRKNLQMVRRVLTRDSLYSTIRAMNEKVFTNSAGFIRVREIGQTSSDLRPTEPLDNTRIHPEWYQMAKDLAEAAIEKEAKRNTEEVDDDVPNMAVERVMKNPDTLDSVDIEEYAQSVHVEGQSKRLKTLELIKSELQRGFQEWRRSYSEPSQEECFYLMTGESKETLFEGRIVQATVRRVQEHQLMCVLECGLLGFIQKEDVSDDGDVELKDKFSEGSSVTCRVKEVKKDKYLVDLTCKESDLQEDSKDDLHHRDKRSKPDITFLLNEREKTRMKKEEYIRKTFKTRPIVHPKFENLSTDDAIKMLAEKDIGDFIIHPSSKGPAHLAIALKISDGLFSHIDIAEGGKENWDLASFLRLGKTLTIGDDSYKSLDEVVSKHVGVIVTHLNAILQYRKYKQGNKSEIADALRSEKAEKPKCIPYCISIAHEYPGAFMLSYIRAANCYHEYISLVPSGFRFRRKVFDTVEKLVVYFQSHFHDPVPQAPSRGKGRGGEKDGKGVCYAFQRGDCSNGASCKFLHEKREERPRGVCYAFQRGECNDGDDCKFLHEKQEERPRGVCYSFQRGDCSNGDDCKFLHEKQEERPRGVCYSFQRGDCSNGDDCKFLHEKRDENAPEVCRAFQRGDCSRGDGCRYVHDGRPREACRAFQRGACSRGDGCRFAHAEQGDGEPGSGTNRTTNSNGGHSDWNNGTANNIWGDEGGKRSDAEGKDDWNDAAGGGLDSAWGDKDISSNTGAEADGWGATNAAGGGSDSAWGDKDISSNTEADADGWGAINAGGGGSDSAWGDKGISSNKEAEADGWGATNAAGGGSDSAWGDKGISTNKEAEVDGWGATNAAGGGSDSAWVDKGISSNTEAEDDGWGATNAAGGGGGGGWDDWNASADGEAGAPANAASTGGGWDSSIGPADGSGANAATRDGGASWGVTAEKEDNVWGGTSNATWSNVDKSKSSYEKQGERPRGVCYAFQRGDCSNGDGCRFLHEKQEERPRGVCYAFQRGDCSNGDGCRFLHEKQEERPRGVCFAFQRGDCSNGDGCRFLHEKQEERPRGVCFSFQRGDCSRGTDCRFLHEKREGSAPEVCHAFQRGACSRGDGCRFAHDKQDTDKPREACHAFQRGACSRGDGCRFAHDKQDTGRPREACHAFQRGNCSRGDSCRYAHAEQGGDGAGSASWKPSQRDEAGSGMNRRNANWGGNTNDAKGKDDWNDAAGTGLDSTRGDKGKSINTEAEDDGWGTSNAADGGWDDWNASAAEEGCAPAHTASKGGGWDSPTGPAATTTASGDGGAGWGDNPGKDDNAWSETANAASGSGGWDVSEGGKSKGKDAWDAGTKSTGGDDGWGGTANAASGSGGWDVSEREGDKSKGKDAWDAGTKSSGGDDGWGGTANAASGSGGWDVSEREGDKSKGKDAWDAVTKSSGGDDGWGGTSNAASGSRGWDDGQGEGDRNSGKDAWDAGTKSTGDDDGWG